MAQSVKKLATYQDVLNSPPHMRAEVINGDLHLQPRPSRKHALVASVLGMDLGAAFHRGRSGPGGWIIVDEPELHLETDVLVPDLAGWRRENYPDSDEDEAFFVRPPDWTCEVLSPRTAKRDRTEKMVIYARHGVPFLWLIDPQLHTLEVFKLQGKDWLLVGTHKDDALVRAEPFDAIELELDALWT